MDEDPLIFAIKTSLNNRLNTRSFISQLINDDRNDIHTAMEKLKCDISASDSSRRVTYKAINPSLSVHDIYTRKKGIREDLRINFTRFRLSAHWLAVEVGRWKRRGRGRLPLEERLCPCGQVQTEVHVIEQCPLSQHIRDTYTYSTLQELFSGSFDNTRLCIIISSILNLYSHNL